MLGVEPQARWGALLGQQHHPLDGGYLSCSIYIPLESDFEPAHHSQGEQLYSILQISVTILGCNSEPSTVDNGLSIDNETTVRAEYYQSVITTLSFSQNIQCVSVA